MFRHQTIAAFATVARLRTLALALFFSFAASAAISAEPIVGETLGTLLFSPAERSAQTLARGGKIDVEASGNAVLTVSGLVHRPRGKSTVWLNHYPYSEGQPVPPAGVPAIAPSGVALAGRHARVGETLDLTGNERSDLVPSGTLRIRQ